jgi:hypothetical protein
MPEPTKKRMKPADPERAPLDRRMLDAEWKGEITDKIKAIDLRHAALESEVSGLKRGQSDITAELEANTTITRETKAAIDRHAARTQPLVEGWDSLQAGISFLGKIGSLGDRVARMGWRLGKWGLAVAGGWLFFKHILSGDGLEVAIAAFTKAVGAK